MARAAKKSAKVATAETSVAAETERGFDKASATATASVTLQSDLMFRALSAAKVWASTDETRPHLHSVLVEISGSRVRFVATNGHGLFKMDVFGRESSGSQQLLITRASIDAALGTLRPVKSAKKSIPVTLSCDASSVTAARLDVAGTLVPMRLAGEDFPPYLRVIPSGERKGIEGGALGIAATYLSALGQTFDDAPVTLSTFGDKLDPMVWTGKVCGEDASVVLMPCRI